MPYLCNYAHIMFQTKVKVLCLYDYGHIMSQITIKMPCWHNYAHIMLALSHELLMTYAFTHEHKILVGLAIYHVTETLVLVQEAYGNKALNQSNVFRCYS